MGLDLRYSLMTIVGAQPVVDVENVVVVLVIVAIVMRGLAGFCQNSSWVMCRFVSELWVADMIRIN